MGPQFSMWMFVSSFLPFVVSWFLANFWSSWVRSERHVATPKTGLAPTRGFGAAVFGLACFKIEIENSLEMALSKAKSGSAGNPIFGSLEPARNTKLFTLRK